MKKELIENIRSEIEFNEGTEQTIETMTFTYEELIKYIDLYHNDLVNKIISKLLKNE